MKNCVYKFINDNEEIIYIGKAKSLESRLKSHKNAPHLDENVYAEVRRIEYISYLTYMDAGVMERILIAYYKPKYNTQFTEEGEQSIIDSKQIDNLEWKLFCYYPNGFTIQKEKRKRMGKLSNADFVVVDNEGVSFEAYFYKIHRVNKVPKGYKCIGCLACLCDEEENIHEFYDIYYESYVDNFKKYDFKTTIFREKVYRYQIDKYRHKLNIPFGYKGTGNCIYIGDKRTISRYKYKDNDMESIATSIALELLTRNGEVNEMDYYKLLNPEWEIEYV